MVMEGRGIERFHTGGSILFKLVKEASVRTMTLNKKYTVPGLILCHQGLIRAAVIRDFLRRALFENLAAL